MSRMRSKMSKKNKWYIDPERYLELKHFCLQYLTIMSKEYEIEKSLLSASGAVRRIKGKDILDYIPDPTCDKALQLVKLRNQEELIRECAREAAGTDADMYDYIMMGVTKGISYDNMYMIGIPCGKDYYYDCYHKFFYILDQKRD